jgi:hypothetical protein
MNWILWAFGYGIDSCVHYHCIIIYNIKDRKLRVIINESSRISERNKVFSRAAVVGKVRDGKINFEVHLKSGGTT